MKKKIALIFGVTGQDGAYLSRFLLKKKYIVHGVIRRSSSFNTSRLDDIYEDPSLKNRKLYIYIFVPFSCGVITLCNSIVKSNFKIVPEVYFRLVETRFGNCDEFSWRYEAHVKL